MRSTAIHDAEIDRMTLAPERPLGAPRSYLVALSLAVLLSLTAAVFWPAIRGPFVFDDFPNLQNLSQLQGTLDPRHLRQYLAAFNGNPGRPLAALSFVIEDASWPTDPLPFKRDNLLLHLLAGVLLFALARRLARLLPRTAPWDNQIALTTMAMWLLHPIQLSATMLVVQRMNILSTIFIVVGLIAYLRCLRAESWPQFRRVAFAGIALAISATLAILCKENGILVFAYAIALNTTLLRVEIASFSKGSRLLLHAGVAAPLLMLAAGGLISIEAIQYDYRFRDFTLIERLLTEPRVVIDYVQTLLIPRIGGQGIFHDDYQVSHGLFTPPVTALCIALLVALAVSAWRLRVRQPIYAFAVAWFFSGHLLESTVWPLELYFEHRNYLPMFGPFFAVAAAVASAPVIYRKGAWLLLCTWITMAAGLTALNSRTWGNRGALATVWLREAPNSVRAIQMMASYQADSGDTQGARKTLVDGLARVPQARELAMQAALLDCVTVGLTSAQLNELVATANSARNTRLLPELVGRLGNELRDGRCHGTIDVANFLRLSNALMTNPNFSWDREGLGYLYYELSKQAAHDRDLDRLMEYLDASYRYRPNPLVPREQAIYLLTAGLPEEAMRFLRKSESTPQPWIKAKLLDIKSMNEPLWQSARKMQGTMGGKANSH